jgi:type IV secretory pathway VirB10-like protein
MGANAVGGEKDPEGFSGVKKFLDPKLLVPVLGAVALWALMRPTSVPQPMNRSVISAADVTSLVATTPQPVVTPLRPTVTAPPMPTTPPAPPQQTLATTDVVQPPAGVAQQAVPPPQPTASPTISPATIARQQRAQEDRDALDAPLVAVAVKASPEAAPRTAADVLWLRRGMSIVATLYTSIDSTVPSGLIVAYLSEPVYDFTHRRIIAPRGAKLIGSYGSSGTSIAQGQARIPATFDQIQLADRVIDLGAQPGIDQTGTTGLGATVDNHNRKALANFLVLAAVGAVLNRGGGCGSNCGVSYSSNSSSVGGSVIQSGQQMLAPHNATPEQSTLHVSEGAQIGLMLTTDIVVKEWKP